MSAPRGGLDIHAAQSRGFFERCISQAALELVREVHRKRRDLTHS
jgi:hypothetical protein